MREINLNHRLKQIILNKDKIQYNHQNKKQTISLKKKCLMITLSIISFFTFMVGFVYIPTFFWEEETENLLTVKDISGIIQTTIQEQASKDYDNDGLINQKEIEQGTNPYYVDSDRDGISDNAEVSIFKSDPVNKSVITDYYDATQITVNTPYSENGIILWADNIESKLLGSVTNTAFGQYRFIKFKGWAQFPNGRYAYKIIDDVHIPLTYRETENAHYIDCDCVVELYDEPLEMVNRFSFFGHTVYADDNFFFNIFSFLLPDRKGFIQGEKLALKDTIPSTNDAFYSVLSEIEYTFDDNRFQSNTNSLSDLTDVLNSLQEGRCVLTSFYSQGKGESLAIIYGYNDKGQLEAVDYYNQNIYVTISITENTSKYLNNTDQITALNIFEFEGAGYSSYEGDCINFLASSILT